MHIDEYTRLFMKPLQITLGCPTAIHIRLNGYLFMFLPVQVYHTRGAVINDTALRAIKLTQLQDLVPFVSDDRTFDCSFDRAFESMFNHNIGFYENIDS